MPSPFEMGRAIGGNVSGGIREGLENNNIDKILQEAEATGNPAQVQNMMNQMLTRISPEKRPLVAQALKQRHEQIVKSNTQNEMIKIADQIETNNPGSANHKMIADVYRSNIPTAEKERIIKGISNTLPFKFEQQARLKQDSIVKNYNALIKETSAELQRMKDGSGSSKEIAQLTARVKKLKQERDNTLDFDALKEKEEKIGKSGKVIYDPENEVHKAEAEALFKEYGNKKRVQKELSKRYEF